MTNLTPAQKRYLGEIRQSGPEGRRYNGRARRPLKALEDAGLITIERDSWMRAKGTGTELVEEFIAKPVNGTSLRISATARERSSGWSGYVVANFAGLRWEHRCDHNHRTFPGAEECARKTALKVRDQEEGR